LEVAPDIELRVPKIKGQGTSAAPDREFPFADYAIPTAILDSGRNRSPDHVKIN
jgi:hypothetical protein